MDRNIDVLIQRVKDMQISTVYFERFADPMVMGHGQRGLVSKSFGLPMKADIFSRICWQLRTRSGVNIYAWMPVLSWDLDHIERE